VAQISIKLAYLSIKLVAPSHGRNLLAKLLYPIFLNSEFIIFNRNVNYVKIFEVRLLIHLVFYFIALGSGLHKSPDIIMFVPFFIQFFYLQYIKELLK